MISTAGAGMRIATVCLDCSDVHAMADFYGRLLGWEICAQEPGWVLMRDPNGGTGLSFQSEETYQSPTWPDQPHRQAKMLHLDIQVDDLEAGLQHALDAGATLADHQPQDGVRVLMDPAGHPFCLFID